jgi:phosphoribosylglycinamide formyltransferase 1
MYTKDRLRIAIIASSGGGVFRELYAVCSQMQTPVIDFVVVTDRACGIETFCNERHIACSRIEEPDNAEFSRKCHEYLTSFGHIDCIYLFFLRLVTAEIYERYLTINFHPSLLPAYTGFNALRRLIRDKGRFVGATAHLAGAKADLGLILAQTIRPISPCELDEDRLNKLSFLQKTYLILVITELLLMGRLSFNEQTMQLTYDSEALPSNASCNPCLSGYDFKNAFEKIEERERHKVIL